MIVISCPSCAAKYTVGKDSLPPEGRSVRCARCRNIWQAIPLEPDPEVLPPAAWFEPPRGKHEEDGATLVPEDQDQDVQLGKGDQSESAEAMLRARLAARTATARIRSLGRAKPAAGVPGLIIGAALALAVSAVYYRVDVVQAVPSAAGLYALAGMPVNLRGLDFNNVTQRRVFEDGLPVMIVEGEIVNLRPRGTPVPALRFALRGSNGAEIYTWTVEPRQAVLEAGASMSFRTRLAAPPRGAEDILLRFSERSRRVVEIRQ